MSELENSVSSLENSGFLDNSTENKKTPSEKSTDTPSSDLFFDGLLDNNLNNESTGEELESNEEESTKCGICQQKLQQPRILSCLHIFCTECLKKQLKEDNTNALSIEGIDFPISSAFQCRLCEQQTNLPKHSKGDGTVDGVESLPLDIITMNLQDLADIQSQLIVCTSCKAGKKAVARCSDCASFLCSHCVTAHNFMRCFENHKVVSFEEINTKGGEVLHKAKFCATHSTEKLSFYCISCQLLICGDCTTTTHKQPGHQFQSLSETKTNFDGELRSLVTEMQQKEAVCNESMTTLGTALDELQMQRDNAKGLLEETFQSYRTVLEKTHSRLIDELEKIHSNKELQIMDMFHIIEKNSEKIGVASRFAQRVLDHGSVFDSIELNDLVSHQLHSLINNIPVPDIDVNINFSTESNQFEEAVNKNFGRFINSDEKLKNNNKNPFSSTSGPVSTLNSVFSNESYLTGLLAPVTTTTTIMNNPSIPPSSPAVGDLISGFSHPLSPSFSNIPTAAGIKPLNGASIPTSISVPTTPGGTTSERSSSRNSYSPAMSDSGISVEGGVTNGNGSTTISSGNCLPNSQSMLNISALNKMGVVSISNQGQVLINGTAIPGLFLPNVNSKNQGVIPTPSALMSLLENNFGNVEDINPAQLNELLGLMGQHLSAGSTSNVSSSADQSSSFSASSTSLHCITNPFGQAITAAGGNSPAPASSALGNGSVTPGNVTPCTPCTPNMATGGFLPSVHPPFPNRPSNRTSSMQIRCKFGQLGPGKSQFNSPHGFCLGMDEDIIVADTNNHRIQVFEKTGEFKYQFGIPGREEGQLWYPRKVTVLKSSGKYVVCDRGNERSRMQIFTKTGHFIKKIAIRYIDIVAGLAVSQSGSIVAVDSVSPTVFVISEDGELLKWFDCSDYMREPSDLAVNGNEYFVCDFKGHCVVVFNEEGSFMRRIGCENITNFPNGIDISDAGDVLIGDSHGNRFHVAVFQRDGSIIGEFECPYVKVSRCCGLKITTEGLVVTLAKNNHHVLVLHTLYIS